jgi:hypothetical protein
VGGNENSPLPIALESSDLIETGKATRPEKCKQLCEKHGTDVVDSDYANQEKDVVERTM